MPKVKLPVRRKRSKDQNRYLVWTAEGIDAYFEYRRLMNAAWSRFEEAKNTRYERQAKFEEEAIDRAASEVYEKTMQRIAKKYPGVPRAP